MATHPPIEIDFGISSNLLHWRFCRHNSQIGSEDQSSNSMLICVQTGTLSFSHSRTKPLMLTFTTCVFKSAPPLFTGLLPQCTLPWPGYGPVGYRGSVLTCVFKGKNQARMQPKIYGEGEGVGQANFSGLICVHFCCIEKIYSIYECIFVCKTAKK